MTVQQCPICGDNVWFGHEYFHRDDIDFHPPVPDYRDLARRLAEALGEHRNCAVVQSHEEDRLVCTSCGASTARKYVKHGYSCRHAKDRRLLAEAKGMLASEQATPESKVQSR